MLLSMTGFGEAQRKDASIAVAVEVRTINSRYFKLVVRCGEGYSALEPLVENVVRDQIKRGTVQVSLRIDRSTATSFNWMPPCSAAIVGNSKKSPRLEAQGRRRPSSHSWRCPAWSIGSNITAERRGGRLAARARDAGGGHGEHDSRCAPKKAPAMAADLAANCLDDRRRTGRDRRPAPLVAEAYRDRLTERVAKTLAEFEITLQPGDLIRELSIYAERSDISEEIVRLRSHLEQFGADAGTAREFGPQARVPDAGNVSRDEHHRLEGQRRADLAARDRDQGARSSGSAR